jgi:hypothetical protein
VEKTCVKPVAVGAALFRVPLAPHDTRDPSVRRAVNPSKEDQTSTKLEPVGPFSPPCIPFPQTAMLPLRFSAA